MVKLKFILRNGLLVLRISEGKERYYKSVKNILIGQPNVQRHWKADKERFSSYAVSFKENNKALEEFKQVYQNLCKEHPEFNARQVAMFYSNSIIAKRERASSGQSTFVEQYIEIIIEREKKKQGCNFEVYKKLLAKCRKVIPDFNYLTFSDIDYDYCVKLAGIFAKSGGFVGISKSFRAVLGRASREKDVDFSLAKIGDFNFNDYNPNKYDNGLRSPDVLTPEQMRDFMDISVVNLTPGWKDRVQVELFHDFCIFMFQSFFAPCDVIKLKASNITRSHTISARRKKTHKMVEIPITPKMEEIILKYSGKSDDGYIFPIMDDEIEASHATTKDYLFKKFRQKLNVWLKDVGDELGCKFNLYAYVFRHTAITVAIDHGLPVSYVAYAAGTSVEIIQKHYYNGNNADNHKKLQMAFMQVGV